MDKNQIRKDIEGLIENIKEHFDNALNYDHIPQLELETILSKIQKLHHKAIVFHYLNEKQFEDEHTTAYVHISKEPEIKPKVQTDLFGGPVNPKPTATAAQKTEPASEKKQAAIDDIRSAIGLNEKFQFINELFGGDQNEYNAAIDQLNANTSLSDAESYLTSIKEIYKWKEEDMIVEKFMSILKRKLQG